MTNQEEQKQDMETKRLELVTPSGVTLTILHNDKVSQAFWGTGMRTFDGYNHLKRAGRYMRACIYQKWDLC